MKLVMILSALLLISQVSVAQVIFSPGIGYYSTETETTDPAPSSSSSTENRIDLRFGYVLPMGLYVGGMYSMVDSETCSGSTCSDNSGFLAGPTIGYNSYTGFYALMTYHIMGEQGDGTKFTGGTGPQVDLGWVFPLSAYFSIGPQITYRSIEFAERESNGVTVDTDRTATSIAPYLSLWFMF